MIEGTFEDFKYSLRIKDEKFFVSIYGQTSYIESYRFDLESNDLNGQFILDEFICSRNNYTKSSNFHRDLLELGKNVYSTIVEKWQNYFNNNPQMYTPLLISHYEKSKNVFVQQKQQLESQIQTLNEKLDEIHKSSNIAKRSKMSLRDIFNIGAIHLLTQNRMSGVVGNCKYRENHIHNNEIKCGAGPFIDDEEYSEKMEGKTFDQVNNDFKLGYSEEQVHLIVKLQHIHDFIIIQRWKGELIELAQRFNLDPSLVENYKEKTECNQT